MTRWLVVVGAIALPVRAAADPLQLRADALASTAAPAGLVTLEATGEASPGLSAEAVVWSGSAGDQAPPEGGGRGGRARTADGLASARIGRFVESLGALQPIQIDGAAGRLRLPLELDVEAYAGVPVPSGLTTSRAWSWAVGGRVARRIGDYGSVGVAYTQQRDDGVLAREEVGLDAGAALGAHDDVGARLAYDLVSPGLAEVGVSASHRAKRWRTSLYVTQRAAAHLLPATSLFSVLGDVPATRAGAVTTWRAAPRLDVIADLGVERVDHDVAPQLALRGLLRLDDLGTSTLTGEVRRDGVGTDTWTGARGAARIGLPCALSVTTELELVVPDHAHGQGAAWPWGIVALGWDRAGWQAAVAVEASASPEDRHRVDVLGQLARRWGIP